MRKVALIGSGITSLATAHALRRRGYAVTVYSDRTPAQWLTESHPTGTAARFELAQTFERASGLNHWDDVAPRGEGVYLTFCPTPQKPLIKLLGRCAKPFRAIDLRLQCHRWMTDFDGTLNIETIDVPRLDQIASEHDLTIVAAGRSDLMRLFPRDASRSVYDRPQRHLMMLVGAGTMPAEDIDYSPVRFELLGTDGEIFFVPYLQKDGIPSVNVVLEARPGSRMDRFTDVRSGDEVVIRLKHLVRDLFPWLSHWVDKLTLADERGWLTGRFAPTVRVPVGTLPSGRVVTALGDTAISYDPIAAQGANSGMKQAAHLVDAIVARGDEPFDAQWMMSTFDAFWHEHARHACAFSNLFLEPIAAPAKEILIAQCGSDGRMSNHSPQQRIANAFFDNFNDPRELTEDLLDMRRARAFIERTSGQSWLRNAVRGRARVVAGML